MLNNIAVKRLFLFLFSFNFSSLGMMAIAQDQLTEATKVTINGIGLIRVGMTPTKASQASGTAIVPIGKVDPECAYYQPKGQLKDVLLMVNQGKITRIDIKNPQITTRSGAKIGDTEARIKSLYPGQIKVTSHKYVPKGHYLTFMPKDAADQNYRIIFETDGNRVTRYRAGQLPQVEWVEGCS